MATTRYIAAYDVESGECLTACRRIVAVHRRFAMPATFFVVGRLLEGQPDEFRDLLDDPLFEIASHSYSHGLLRDHELCGPGLPPDGVRREIEQGVQWVERVFERPCRGLRTPCGFLDGLSGAPEVLALLQEAGLQYVSSKAWGPDWSLPIPLYQPFAYADDGFPDLWELPCHGWHENLLKDNNGWGPRRLTLWPPEMPEAIPPKFIETPEEEFAVNRVFIERAAEEKRMFVSLVWHPWSLGRFDPEMQMLELTFAHVQALGLECGTYEQLRRQCG